MLLFLFKCAKGMEKEGKNAKQLNCYITHLKNKIPNILN